jgi:hypothetical protein
MPTPVSVVDPTVCGAPLTVPSHVPEAQGLGESVRMVVPAAAPAMTMPTAREPDDTAVIVRAPEEAMLPVTAGAENPAAQNDPAGH